MPVSCPAPCFKWFWLLIPVIDWEIVELCLQQTIEQLWNPANRSRIVILNSFQVLLHLRAQVYLSDSILLWVFYFATWEIALSFHSITSMTDLEQCQFQDKLGAKFFYREF